MSVVSESAKADQLTALLADLLLVGSQGNAVSLDSLEFMLAQLSLFQCVASEHAEADGNEADMLFTLGAINLLLVLTRTVDIASARLALEEL